ncbi:aspartate aminotransferase family protein [Microbacterium sp. 179-B 1A2 NHS]|uniref:pyridoxal phosphate-dependent decarboxylase family protein n=1 Tax=Microbacterium sp. 179-B 1A2 NHS TaxID=3142383 RepID=UPI0039A182BB
MDARERALEVAHHEAGRFLASLTDRPVWPRADVAEMERVFGGPLPEDGEDPASVVATLARDAEPGLVGIPGGRFFGFVIGGTLPAALAADWLVSAWDQNSGSTTMTTAVAALERTAGAWICELLGLPADASVGFVTGAQVSNTVCLATAQHAQLRRVGWDQTRQGLRGAPRVRLVVGEHRHASIDRGARFCGWGSDELVVVPTDDQGRMRPADLAAALEADRGAPAVVCLQAGEVHTGAFDPFEDLLPVARAAGAWVHIDGAFGLWAAASPALRHLVAGTGEADSWTTDAHKTLNVPYDCGMAIVRDAADSIAMLRTAGDYLIYSRMDPWDVTPELSRRGRGVPAWAALRSLGRSGVAALVEGMCENAQRLADGLARIPGVTVVNDVVYTQVMFRLDDDGATRALCAAILAEGTAAMTGADWAGRAVIRCSVSSWVTTADDVALTLEAIRSLVAAR